MFTTRFLDSIPSFSYNSIFLILSFSKLVKNYIVKRSLILIRLMLKRLGRNFLMVRSSLEVHKVKLNMIYSHYFE